MKHPKQPKFPGFVFTEEELKDLAEIYLILKVKPSPLIQAAMLPKTSMLIRMGRNWGIGVWATTRRIQDINKRFLHWLSLFLRRIKWNISTR